MKNNIYSGQLFGPFKAKEELYSKITEQCPWNCLYVKHLGIETEKNNIIYINNKPFQIGITNIFELGDTEIKSIYFENDTRNDSIIDFVIESEEEY